MHGGRVETIQGDQQSTQECYQKSLAMERENIALVGAPFPEALDGYIDCWDSGLDAGNERLTPTEDLKEVRIGPLTHQVTKIGISLIKEEENELVDQLIRNINLFF